MKIGILTFHDANHHGAVLQAYALKETLKMYSEDVEIINYKQPYILKNNKLFNINFKNVKLFFKSLLISLLYFFIKIKKGQKFNQFRKEYLSVSSLSCDSSKEIEYKDIFIVGSDQIWNFKITMFDKAFFLDFCKDSVRIAYAASLGTSFLSETDYTFIKNHIINFDHISVREDSGVESIKKITNQDVFHVLDPTLLVEESTWAALCKSKYSIKDRYLLVYELSGSNDVMQIAQDVALKLDLDIYKIDDSLIREPYVYSKIRNVGPVDFLSLVRDASFVVTNSYHGTIFSIIFNKKFISVPNNYTGDRVISLMRLFNLENRLVYNCNELENVLRCEIDFEKVKEILEIETKKSLNFLTKAICNGYNRK